MELKQRIIKIIDKIISFSKIKEKRIFFTQDAFKNNKFKIGEYTYGIPDVVFEHPNSNLEVGKFCSIADNVTIFLGGNHNAEWISTYPFPALSNYFPEATNINGHPSTNGSVIIGNDVWIGRNVIILSGINIGNGAIIGAGSLISKNVGAYEVWAGNPGKFIKKRFDDPFITRLNEEQWWNWDIEKIKKNIPLLCSTNYESMFKKM